MSFLKAPTLPQVTEVNECANFTEVRIGNENIVLSDADSETSTDSLTSALYRFDDSSESVDCDSDIGDDEEFNLSQKVASLAIKHRLTHSATNAILELLLDIGCEVPKDARTILGTTRSKSDEHFEHFGLIRGIVRKLRNGMPPVTTHSLTLQIHVDGIPLFHSSKTNFWPILGRIVNCTDSRPFIISVYCGPSKPPNLQEYLQPFIDEMKNLEKRSLTVDRRSFQVILKAIVCDAPARSFVKAIVGHMGFFGCERCVQKGKKINGAMTFPNLSATLRDGNTFRAERNKPHHTGVSPFKELKIDMVNVFVLDYMHLVCQGVMKRLLLIWRGKRKTTSSRSPRKTKKTSNKSKDLAHRIPFDRQQIINKRIVAVSAFFPIEFQRKGRPLEDLEMWKAVEYRHFLLYSGPVVLRGILTDEKYFHFLYFHVAIRILASPSSTTDEIEYASQCLKYFVDQFGAIYGAHHLVYNVHSLIHIADDCKFQQGSLDLFSAFPFESYLGQLKNLLRGTRRPLAQLKKRISEIEYNNEPTCPKNYFHDCKFDLLTLKPCSKADSLLLIVNTRQVFKVIDITESDVFGIKMKVENDQGSFENLYNDPLKSSRLNIYVSKFPINENVAVKISLSELPHFVKCVGIPYDEKIAIFPILHNL